MTGKRADRQFATAIIWSAIAVVAGIFLITLTAQLGPTTPLSGLAPHRQRLITAEIAFVGVPVLELLTRAFVRRARTQEGLQASIAIGMVVRLVGYVVIAIAVLSILAANPALAVGVGRVTGLVVGLAAQNVIGNTLAGAILVIARPFKVGKEIAVMGLSGRVLEVRTMHTVIDPGDKQAVVPDMVMLSNIVQRRRNVR